MARYMLTRDGTTPEGVILWDGAAPLDLPGYQIIPLASWTGALEAPRPARELNRAALADRLARMADNLRDHRVRGTFTAAQRDNALMLLIRGQLALIRLALDDTEGTE